MPTDSPILPDWTVVGFSGHRELSHPRVVAGALHTVFDRLVESHGPLASVSSVASGADTLYVEEVVGRKNIPYLLVLPFPQNRFQRDFSETDWQRILPLIEGANRREEIMGEDSPERAYMEAGLRTVDRADIMVVVWDKKPAAGQGGTGDVADYAQKLGKPLIIINPVTGASNELPKRKVPARPAVAGWEKDPRGAVQRHFDWLNGEAEKNAPKSRLSDLKIIGFQLGAATLGISSPVFSPDDPDIARLLMFGELLLLGLALYTLRQRGKPHEEWVKDRISAEICRSFLATWQMRRTDYYPHVTIGKYSSLCRNLRLIRIWDTSAPGLLETARDSYLKDRVEDQIRYFTKHSAIARAQDKRSRWWGTFMTWSAISLIIAMLAFALAKDFKRLSKDRGWPFEIAEFLSLVLPLAVAAVFAKMLSHDFSRRAVRYHEMAAMLEVTANRLKMVRTWSALARIAAETEEALLQEVVEWHAFRQAAGEPH